MVGLPLLLPAASVPSVSFCILLVFSRLHYFLRYCHDFVVSVNLMFLVLHVNLSLLRVMSLVTGNTRDAVELSLPIFVSIFISPPPLSLSLSLSLSISLFLSLSQQQTYFGRNVAHNNGTMAKQPQSNTFSSGRWG